MFSSIHINYNLITGCGHCKKMMPNYSKAAKDMKDKGVKVRLAAIDCSANLVTSDKYEITAFPTLKLFSNGKFMSNYTGGRTYEDLMTYAKNLLVKGKKEEL